MLQKLYLSLAFILLTLHLSGSIIEVKQDGSGSFTTIQEGVDFATVNDTVLVYPGFYQENILIDEKSITLSSLYHTTLQDSFIKQTIIDGSNSARCIKVNDSSNTSIIGLTLQNGSAILDNYYEGREGGGIFVVDSPETEISNCLIYNNAAISGGGINVLRSTVILSGNNVSYNKASSSGGGICFSGVNTTVQFGEDDLNNIYLNYAGTGADIFVGYNIPEIVNFVVDTFTVMEPDYFNISPIEYCTLSIQNCKIEEIDQDLYISPDGDDSNSGLSSEEPLQTIAWAQTIIKRNDDNPNSIHLAPGTYSPSLNNQILPLGVKHGIIIKGNSPENTFIDAESESPFVNTFSRRHSEFSKLVFRNITFINGKETFTMSNGGIFVYQADIHLSNVIIENCDGDWSGALEAHNGYCNLDSVIIRNNTGNCAVSFVTEGLCPNPITEITVKNSQVYNNNPSTEDPDFASGGAFKIIGLPDSDANYNVRIINSLIYNNLNVMQYQSTGLGGATAMKISKSMNVDIVNCTIGNNRLLHNDGCSISVEKAKANLYNTILYGNEGYSFNLLEDAEVNITNSLIESGEDNVNYYDPSAVLNWMDSNIEDNPLWDENEENLYFLTADSPCIDAGTLNLPEDIELPEFDLAGNPRIVGNGIDMGCYEYQDSVAVYEETVPNITETRLFNYPNPFNPATTINFELAQAGNVDLSIYNIKGQKVKTLMDSYSAVGIFEIVWNGVDNKGSQVASGNYIAKCTINGKEITTTKMTLLK